MTIPVAQAAVTVSARHRQTTAYVRIAGEIDMAIEAALQDAIDRLVALAPHTVEVDLTAVTFSGASLANFIAHVYRVIPDGATIVANGASPSVRRVLEATGTSELVHLREDDEPLAIDRRHETAVQPLTPLLSRERPRSPHETSSSTPQPACGPPAL